jgi:hypothetical protein
MEINFMVWKYFSPEQLSPGAATWIGQQSIYTQAYPRVFWDPAQLNLLRPTSSPDPDRFLPTTTDLNCDGISESFTSRYDAVAILQNPQWYVAYSEIHFSSEEYSFDWPDPGGGKYFAELFYLGDGCEQLLAVQDHAREQGISIYRWDGQELSVVLESESYEWLGDDWDTIQSLPQTPGEPFTLQTYDFSMRNCERQSNMYYIVRTYQWDGEQFIKTDQQRVDTPICGGG